MPIAPLVDVDWLQGHPEARRIDCRWSPGVPSRQRYLEGHLPGAAFVDLDRDLSQPGAGGGRHPLPRVEDLAALLGRLGIGAGTHAVVYDDGPGAIAARFWFLLRAHGHQAVSVLDGGLEAWTAAGLPLETAEPRLSPAIPPPLRRDESRFVPRARIEQLVAERGPALLLDARAPERYRGEVEPLDRRAGHIPGAVNAPFADNLDARGRFLAPGELRARLAKLGALSAPEVICSCGSGVTACHDLLALELAGRSDGKLYAGSWSDWSSDDARPIATGPAPG